MGSTQGRRFGVRWAARSDWGIPAGPARTPGERRCPQQPPAPSLEGRPRRGLRCCRAGTRGTSPLRVPSPMCFRPPEPRAPMARLMAAVEWKVVLPCTQEWRPLSGSGDSDSSGTGGTASWPCCHLATASSAHRGEGSTPVAPGSSDGAGPPCRNPQSPPHLTLPRWYRGAPRRAPAHLHGPPAMS